MIVCERNIHDWTRYNLRSLHDGAYLSGVHAKDGTLRHVDDRSTHHRSKDATIGDGEGATGEILQSDLALASLEGKVTKTFLEISKAVVLAVAENRHDESSWGGYSGADVDEIAIDHVVVIDDGVDDRLFFQSGDGCFHEGAHEAKLDSVLLHKGVLHLFAHVHVIAHVDLIEGGKEGVGVLSLFETAGDRLSHLAHLDASLHAGATDLSGGFLCGL